MKWIVAMLAVGLIAAVGIAADDDGKAEMKKLEGTWDVVSIVLSGMKADGTKGMPDKAVVKDGKATFLSEGKEMKTFRDLKIEFVPKKTPQAVDLTQEGKVTLPCIYEVTAEGLKLAIPMVSQVGQPRIALTRPESFDSKDKPFLVLTAKRSKE